MPGAANEGYTQVYGSVLGEDGTRTSRKKLKQQSESRADKERKSLKKPSLSSQKDNFYVITINDGDEGHSGHGKYRKHMDKRSTKKRKGDVKLDEASRLQRRTRYLLIKMKLEQNLIDAYSGDGWKGQSREKIKPDTELQRARVQILKCKLGIREVVRELDLLSSVGRIDDSVVAPDGSVHHEHIICAKCMSLEAFPDNDIILCDGTCNRAFHQNCLDPPLKTENIPPGDEGWFCKLCKTKIEVLEATNAHLGTHFPLDSNWQDIFKEEAVSPDGGVSLEPDWPSDESDDNDYDPEKKDNSCSTDLATSESHSANSTSFSTMGSLEDDLLFLDGGESAPETYIRPDSDDTADCEVTCGRRQRHTVDYIKLNDELFGKNTPIEGQISEDEDWGPTQHKRRGKESDAASTLIVPSENENNVGEGTAEEKMHASMKKIRRPFFRIPCQAVEQLRTVFSENELPSRTVRDNLAKQLGLDFEKVNKWFKNSRYHALKVRKGGKGKLCQSRSKSFEFQGILEAAETGPSNSLVSKSTGFMPHFVGVSDEKVNALSLISPLKVKHHKRAVVASPSDKRPGVDCDDVSDMLLREKGKMKNLKGKNQDIVPVVEAEAETNMETLCRLRGKIQRLRQVLVGLPNSRSNKSYMATDNESPVILLPVAELKVKR
ncbi:chromatin/chromatin-binding, or -regulatory protein [Lithospermum erythrorhizon]|uniref:Chromatin/chromatin-binding, or -regulatory protein n=1 Tax=Lithospermum erythrorhizon TaxID=34254 RepID=A0AAV3RDM6_LITER